MTPILVTGARGQLGSDLLATARRRDQPVIGLDRDALDVTDADSVRRTITDLKPEIVINCAALTHVDASEHDPARAQLVNGTAVKYLAEACAATGAHLVQISTDYVFNGDKPTPYEEDDAPDPVSVYGTSKRSGERYATAVAGTVIRTSWVCGVNGTNMVTTVLRLLDTPDTLRFVDDQRGNPSFTADLAPAIFDLIAERPAGYFHLTNSTPTGNGVTWFEFVQQIVAAAGQNLDRVEPISTAELDPPRPARRPTNGVLANTKTSPLRDYRAALGELVAALRQPR